MKALSKLGLIALMALVTLTGCKEESKVSFSTEKIEKGNIQNSITATGTIEPVTSVTVGTQVSGIVTQTTIPQ